MNYRVRSWAIDLQKLQLAHCEDFASALKELIDLSGRSYQAIASEVGMSAQTLYSWFKLGQAPSTAASIQTVGRLERALGVAPGLLGRHCEVTQVPIRAHLLKINLSSVELRRIRQNLPADFETRSRKEQQTIYDWVMTNMILSPSDDFDEDEGETVDRSPYRCKLLAGGDNDPKGEAFLAPPRLQAEVDALINFKTSDFPPVGMEREERWISPNSAGVQIGRLEMFYGSLSVAGFSKEKMSLANLLDPKLIQTFIDVQRKRRGIYTTSITSALEQFVAHLNPKVGFIPQSWELIDGGRRGGIKEDQWQGACKKAYDFIWSRWHQLEPLVTQGRDPFRPIEVVLDAEKPLHEYYKITDEIRGRMPLAAANEREYARAMRSLMLVRYLLKMPVRASNLAACRLREKGDDKTPMAKLARLRCPELWFDPKEKIWMHRQPKKAFKNWNSPATADVEVPLSDTDGFYKELEDYIAVRKILLGGHEDPGTLFINDMTHGSKRTTCMALGLNALWKRMLQKYGIYNPWTGTGAISGLLPHGPHAVRHVLATHILKTTGSYSWAAAYVMDTEAVVKKRYARFDPADQWLKARHFVDSDHPISQTRR
jgi:transcriptional regulator with XRE-family HTH domain